MQEAFALAPDERLLQKTPFGFDVSVWEFFWPVIAGAALVVAAPEGHRDPAYLGRIIRDQAISTVHFVPSMLGVFLDEADLSLLGGVKRVICSGEALTADLARRFAERLPHCSLYNLYGPTETAVDVSWHHCAFNPTGQVPIGRPVANTQLSVRDARLNQVPIGVPGELCVAGVQLARGYLGAPHLTADRFVPDSDGSPGTRLYRTGDLARWSEDGQIEFLGRMDHQIKLNGHRIELGEVESVLRSSPLVQSAAVVLDTDGPAPLLVGYVVLTEQQDEQTAPERLTALIAEHLPSYMVPSRIVCLPAMPMTNSGKLNRSALRALAPVRPQLPDPPRTRAEMAVMTALHETVGLPDARMSDNFFTVGGDSIRGLRLIARLRTAGYTLRLQDLFASHDLRAIARAMTPGTPTTRPAGIPAAFSLINPADLAVLRRNEEESR